MYQSIALLAILTVSFVLCGSPGCNSPNLSPMSRSLAYHPNIKATLPKSTTTTKISSTTSKAPVITTAPSFVKPTPACANWYGNKGTCCFECTLPYYVSNGQNVPLCSCSGESTFRFTSANCWPYQSINFNNYYTNTMEPTQNTVYSVQSGLIFGMYAFETCVVHFNCSCKDPRTVPQPVIIYNPSPPVGPLADAQIITDYNGVVTQIGIESSNGVLSTAMQILVNNTLDALYPFYYYNDAGDLPMSGSTEIDQLINLAQNVSTLSIAIFEDMNQTIQTSAFYNQFMSYITGELGRIFEFYQTAFTTYAGSLNQTLSQDISVKLSNVNDIIFSLF